MLLISSTVHNRLATAYLLNIKIAFRWKRLCFMIAHIKNLFSEKFSNHSGSFPE